MSDDRLPLRPVSLGRAVRKGFRDAYDHLGYVFFATFLSFLIAVVVFSLAVFAIRTIQLGIVGIALMIPVAFVAYLCAVGVFYYVYKTVFHEYPALKDTWAGVKILFAPAAWLFIVDLLISIVLLGDAVFFLRMFGSHGSLVPIVFGVLCAYLTLVWFMMAMYHIPLLIAQLGMESGTKASVILRKAFLLTADNPGFTLGLFIVIIAFTALCILPAIGVAVLLLGVVAFLLIHALRELFIKYGVVEEESEVVVEEPWKLPESWRKRNSGSPGSDDTNSSI